METRKTLEIAVGTCAQCPFFQPIVDVGMAWCKLLPNYECAEICEELERDREGNMRTIQCKQRSICEAAMVWIMQIDHAQEGIFAGCPLRQGAIMVTLEMGI